MDNSGAVFCDDLRMTIPENSWQDVRAQVEPVFESLGASVEFHSEREQTGWRLDGGTALAKRCGVVWSLSTSGQLLLALRMRKLMGHFMQALAASPHRVTGMHATLDRRISTPPEIDRLLAAVASEAGLRMSRKRVPLSAVQLHLQPREDGSQTGSIYFGKKTAEVRSVVYDKRAERISKGLPDLGHDLTRYELRLRSGVGATLRDVVEPASIFWHFMSPDVLPRPDGVADWSSHVLAMHVERPAPLGAYQRLAARVYSSDDLAAILKLARSCGPWGEEMLVSMIRKRMAGSRAGVQGLAPAEAALSPPEAA